MEEEQIEIDDDEIGFPTDDDVSSDDEEDEFDDDEDEETDALEAFEEEI